MRTSLLLAVILAAALAGCADKTPTMHAATMARMGDDIIITFDTPLEQRSTTLYWITLQRADAPISDTDGRVVLERGDRVAVLHATTPGDYEVRLHDGYPKKDSHLVARLPITILYRAGFQATGPAID